MSLLAHTLIVQFPVLPFTINWFCPLSVTKQGSHQGTLDLYFSGTSMFCSSISKKINRTRSAYILTFKGS